MGKENLTSAFLSKEIKFFQQNLKQIGIIFSLVILISLLFPGGEALKYSYKKKFKDIVKIVGFYSPSDN